jgi:hypothetical protein
LDQRTHELQSATTASGNIPVLGAVHRAQRNRLEKIEHEMMAKLINKSGDKNEQLAQIQELQDAIAKLKSDEHVEQESEDNRKLAALVLSHLIGSMQASLLRDPPEELLPSIDELDMTIFQ